MCCVLDKDYKDKMYKRFEFEKGSRERTCTLNIKTFTRITGPIEPIDPI